MRKSTKIIALLLALLFVVSAFAGCGKNEEEAGPKFTYVPEYNDMPVDADGGWFNSTVYSGGRVYTVLTVPNETGGSSGGDMETYAETETATVTADESADIAIGDSEVYVSPTYTSKLYSFLPDGTDLREYPDFKISESSYDPETGSNTYENINSVIASGDKLFIMKNSGSYIEDPETGSYSSTDKTILCEIDATGNILSEKLIAENTYDSSKDSYSDGGDVNSVISSPDGSRWYLCGRDFVRVCDADLNELFTVDVTDLYDRFFLPDGSFCASVYGDIGMGYKVLDENTKTFGETIDLPTNWWSIMPGSSEYPIMSSTESGIFGFDPETGESVELVNYIGIDLDPSTISGTYYLEDGNILCISSTYTEDSEKYELITLKKTDSAVVQDKKILKMAVMYMDYSVRSKVIEFNKTNPEYRIDVVDYSQFNTDSDYTAGLTKLNTEITSGNIPDIFFYQSIPMDKYASKGLFEDLNPYLERDFGKNAMVEPFYKALLSDDGKLYELYSTFAAQIYFGLEKIVGDGSSWTYKDMMEAYSKLQPGATLLEEYFSKDDAVSLFLDTNMESYVNWKTGECFFDTDDFVGLLKTAELFPAEFNWDEYYGGSKSSLDRVLSGEQLLTSTYLYDINNIRSNTWYMTPEPLSFVGLPSNEGTGNTFTLSGEGYAISSSSKYKDAAWDFIKQIFTEEYWNENGWGIPANQKLFDKVIETAMTPVYPDTNLDDGEFSINEKYATTYPAYPEEEYIVKNDKYGPSIGPDGAEEVPQNYNWTEEGMIAVYAMTEEERDTILEILNGITKISRYDESLQSIISEESQAFYSGQKSAEDTAAMIQSRVKLYVNEQK